MNCLDIFCISYFEEREEYICLTKKGLLLDKEDFAINSYEVDEQKHPQNSNKVASFNNKNKKKHNEVMNYDQSNEDMEEEGTPLQ
jgi:hypothetical protein